MKYRTMLTVCIYLSIASNSLSQVTFSNGKYSLRYNPTQELSYRTETRYQGSKEVNVLLFEGISDAIVLGNIREINKAREYLDRLSITEGQGALTESYASLTDLETVLSLIKQRNLNKFQLFMKGRDKLELLATSTVTMTPLTKSTNGYLHIEKDVRIINYPVFVFYDDVIELGSVSYYLQADHLGKVSSALLGARHTIPVFPEHPVKLNENWQSKAGFGTFYIDFEGTVIFKITESLHFNNQKHLRVKFNGKIKDIVLDGYWLINMSDGSISRSRTTLSTDTGVLGLNGKPMPVKVMIYADRV